MQSTYNKRHDKPSILPFALKLATGGLLVGACTLATIHKPLNEPEAYFGFASTSDGQLVKFFVRGRCDIPNNYTGYDRGQLRDAFDKEAADAARKTIKSVNLATVYSRPDLLSKTICDTTQVSLAWTKAKMTECSVSFKPGSSLK